jgi:XTP/dITP diphosphohydrolase
MMITELLLASNNDHKHREFVRLLPGVRIVLPRDLGIRFDPREDGDTFLSNALGKAVALYGTAHRPVIADDSGLCVEALGGAPGVLSNRFGATEGGAPLSTPRRNELLLSRMEGAGNRAAHFVCCLVLVLGADRFLVAQETVHGVIAAAPRGTNGFGYDPLFLLPGGKTLAEVPDAHKDEVSHRGRAARRILSLMKEDAWT